MNKQTKSDLPIKSSESSDPRDPSDPTEPSEPRDPSDLNDPSEPTLTNGDTKDPSAVLPAAQNNDNIVKTTSNEESSDPTKDKESAQISQVLSLDDVDIIAASAKEVSTPPSIATNDVAKEDVDYYNTLIEVWTDISEELEVRI